MRIDVVTIFPDYFTPLGISLVGKAVDRDLVGLGVHDLRDWTTDRHRTVDDTPAGGGPGMVMRPDVWGTALDDVVGETQGPTTIAIPTPSGRQLTQAAVHDLAESAEHLVIACGRYEGIDARVSDHYATTPGVDVVEFSLGDYVLNGGEVAALALIEAVVRLVPGVVGNAQSLVEESHAAGLVEQPVYTRPVQWRGLDIPGELMTGNHAAVERYRRDESLRRTAAKRPDLIATLPADDLDGADRRALARLGWHLSPGGDHPVRVAVRDAHHDEAAAVSKLAGELFPLACPPDLDPAAINAHIADELNEERFAHFISSPHYLCQVAVTDAGHLVGYTLVVLPAAADQPPANDEVAAAIEALPAAELSKVYVDPAWQGTGVAARLMDAAATATAATFIGGTAVRSLWLGTHENNRRAHTAYHRAGFTQTGRRRFVVGGIANNDVVMVRDLTAETGRRE